MLLQTEEESLSSLPNDLGLTNQNADIPLREVAKKQPRPLSAEFMRDNKVRPGSEVSRQNSVSDSADSEKQQLTLLMYIVGGREVGQVTVFKRPISLWRLDLTKTF